MGGGSIRSRRHDVGKGVCKMGRISSNKSLEQLAEQRDKDLAELDRLINEKDYLNRRIKINEECIDFVKFILLRRQNQIAENAHLVEPWSVGYYSHDAD